MSRRQRALFYLFSLRGRLLFLICLATLPAILFTFFVAENERAAALARTESDALHIASLATREHAQQIEGARELLTWLGGKLTRDGLDSPIVVDPNFLPALLAGHPQLANVGVLSPSGEVLASAYPLPGEQSWQDNPAFRAALGSGEVEAGTYRISPIFARPTLNHALAVRDDEEQPVGVLFSGLDLDWLSAVTRQSQLPEGASLLISDREGRVLNHAEAAGAGASQESALVIPDVAALAESRRGRIVSVRPGEPRRFVVAAPLEGSPDLYAAVSLPYERVLSDVNRAFTRTLIGLGVLTLFTIAAVFVAAELGLLRTLRSLARAAQRFGAGELSARAVAPQGHNEFSALARAFNAMADSLAARHREALDAQARLRALASRLQVAREAEAARIARELHDEIGQVLTSLKIELSRLQGCCATDAEHARCAARIRDGIDTMTTRIAGALDFVRRIASELRPGVLDKLGLTAALEWQARELEGRTDLVIQVEADPEEQTFDERTAVTLFRIAQEALTNVVRHANAHFVELRLTTNADGVALVIHDDGAAISEEAVASGESLGLIGMRERALLIDATLTVRGEPGKGTTVCVFVPRRVDAGTTDGREPTDADLAR